MVRMKGGGLLLPCAVLLVGLLSLSSIACFPGQNDAENVVVAVTILPQAAFVEAVGGDRVETVVMVPPGFSPHTYEPTPEQMMQLSRAAMYASVGSPIEFELAWMDKLISVNRNMLVVDCSYGIDLIKTDGHHHDQDARNHDEHGDQYGGHGTDHHHHGGPDPHIWLSVRNAMTMVTNICEGLVQVDPEHEREYRQNCAVYLEALQRLDEELTAAFEDLENRLFIVYHPAFGYFARDYDLEQIAVEQGGTEPDARYLIRLIEEAREHDIRVVFAAPQFSTRSAEVVAAEIRGEVVLIDPLAKDYIPNLRSVAAAIMQVT